MTVQTSDTIAELAKALTKAQAEFGDIIKNHTAKVGSYQYKYATLTDVLGAVREPLAKHGLAVLQPMCWNERPFLVTRLVHTSGEWIESVYPLSTYDRPQEMGSAITYARRYALTSLLSIAADDDDGQAAQTAEKKPRKATKAAPQSVKQEAAPDEREESSPASADTVRKEWYAAGKAVGVPDDDLMAFMKAKHKVQKTSELTIEQMREDIDFFAELKSAGAETVESFFKGMKDNAA